MKKYLLILLLAANPMSCFAFDQFGHGITIENIDNNLVISDVVKNSIVERNGLEKEQIISKINGKKAAKLKQEDYLHLDSTNKKIKLTVNNTDITLQPENITLLNSYNQINDTYNNQTKYNVENYITEKIILPNYIHNKHINFSNAYFNYADAISIENSKLYTELFSITEENVKKALDTQNESEYKKLYDLLYSSKNNKYDVLGKAFKHFLELAIYSDINQDLIQRQISELDDNQKKLLAQITYNTRIAANLYNYANSELERYTLRNTVNANITDEWSYEFKVQNLTYNTKYKEFRKTLAKNKISINKPGPLSNRAQVKPNYVPTDKWVEHKQILILAKEKGYNPNNNAEMKKILAEKAKQQKQRAQVNTAVEKWELVSNNGQEALIDINSINVHNNSVYYNVKYFKNSVNDYVIVTLQNKNGYVGVVSTCTNSEYLKNKKLADPMTPNVATSFNAVTSTARIYNANKRALQISKYKN